MKAWGLAVVLLVASLRLHAQASKGVRMDFRFSSVVLATDDTLAGSVALRLSPDVLYLRRPDGTLLAFEPAAVKAFAVQSQVLLSGLGASKSAYNPDSTVIRLFRSLALPTLHPDQRPALQFFEQLGSGPVLLLRRPYLMRQAVAIAAITPTAGTTERFMAGQNMSRAPSQPLDRLRGRFVETSEIREAFFLAWPNGDVRALLHIRKDLLAAFPAQAPEIKAFVRHKRITLAAASAAELSELVRLANSLSSTKMP